MAVMVVRRDLWGSDGVDGIDGDCSPIVANLLLCDSLRSS